MLLLYGWKPEEKLQFITVFKPWLHIWECFVNDQINVFESLAYLLLLLWAINRKPALFVSLAGIWLLKVICYVQLNVLTTILFSNLIVIIMCLTFYWMWEYNYIAGNNSQAFFFIPSH